MAVIVAVAADLVPASSHLAEGVGMSLGRDTRDEERRAHVQLVEEVERERDVTLERGVAAPPVVVAQAPAHDLVPVLEVEREDERPGHISTAGTVSGAAASSWNSASVARTPAAAARST